MDDIGEFLAHAIQLEAEAATRFDELADAMTTYGNKEVAKFFRQMAEFSRMHLAEARARAGFRDIPEIAPGQFQWPEGESPEAQGGEGEHYLMTVDYALQLALESETRGRDFYQSVADKTNDPEVRAMALEFVAEESEHVAQLKVWIARQAA